MGAAPPGHSRSDESEGATMTLVAVVAHSGKTLGGGLDELREVLAEAKAGEAEAALSSAQRVKSEKDRAAALGPAPFVAATAGQSTA